MLKWDFVNKLTTFSIYMHITFYIAYLKECQNVRIPRELLTFTIQLNLWILINKGISKKRKLTNENLPLPV